ncbi:MAG: pyruvate kinase [Patescibacteria group bacterium]|jgi:pyruvate kinase
MNTKIVATIGPKSQDYEILKEMIISGVNIVRINFSHATPEQYYAIKTNLDRIKAETGLEVKIIFDLQGPRIRIGKLAHEVEMREGDVYSFLYNAGNVDNMEIPIDDDGLINDVKIGDPFYLANGDLELRIVDIKDGAIMARVERGGLLLSRKAINIPKTILRRDILTAKDLEDIKFALTVNPDYVAMSFVQNGDDVKHLRSLLGDSKIGIIVKIERATALNHIDEIIRESDGVMVARGDLGIEVPLEDLPIIQKNLIRHAHWHDKPAIVATQMMISMVTHSRPTRAEVSDVANAIFDGADSLMLSDETAAGEYPVETIKIMKRIIDKTNYYFNNRNYFEDNEIIYKK